MNPLSSSSASEWINIDFTIDGKQLWLDGLTCSKVRPHRAPDWPHSAAPCRPSPTERQLIPVAFVSEKWFEISCWPPEGLDHFLWVEKTSWIHALVGTGPRCPFLFFQIIVRAADTPSVPAVRLPHFGNSWELGICLFLLHDYARLHVVQRQMKRRPRHPASEVLEAEIRG